MILSLMGRVSVVRGDLTSGDHGGGARGEVGSSKHSHG